MGDDWRKKVRDETLKRRTSTATWTAKTIAHSDLISSLLLVAVVVVTLVLRGQGEVGRGEFAGAVIALVWAWATFRHSRVCNPCPRRAKGSRG